MGGQGEPCHLFGEYYSDSRQRSGLPPTLYESAFDVLNHGYHIMDLDGYPKTKLANLTYCFIWGFPLAVRSEVLYQFDMSDSVGATELKSLNRLD